MYEFIYQIADQEEAKALLDIYVFKIFLCLNPDGVVLGNTRVGLEGSDLNRVWQKPYQNLHPTISAAYKIMKHFDIKRGIAFYGDFHGHSSKCGCFMYGCPLPKNYTFSTWSKMHLIPQTMSKLTQLFSYPDCSYTISNYKVFFKKL